MGRNLRRLKLITWLTFFLKSYPKERKYNINFHNIFKTFLFFVTVIQLIESSEYCDLATLVDEVYHCNGLKSHPQRSLAEPHTHIGR